MTTKFGRLLFLAAMALGTGACGGGGGGDGTTPPPPPPPTSVTYSVQLTAIDITDSRTGAAVSPTGLPVAGAVATRQ